MQLCTPGLQLLRCQPSTVPEGQLPSQPKASALQHRHCQPPLSWPSSPSFTRAKAAACWLSQRGEEIYVHRFRVNKVVEGRWHPVR